MKIRNPRSITIISLYACLNAFIIYSALTLNTEQMKANQTPGTLAPEFTLIEDLDYYHLKEGLPEMSVTASEMRSEGEAFAEFKSPHGVYHHEKSKPPIRYKADEGSYQKAKEVLIMNNNVNIVSDDAEYLAKRIRYFFKKDLILGSGGVIFKGHDPKTQDKFEIHSSTMRANPNSQYSIFKGGVSGSMERKKKYEGKMTFSSQTMQLDGVKSLAELQGDVKVARQSYVITAGKGDIYLENYNKSLKYFVFNDDVKVTEKLQTPEGITYRKAFAERLEGFGKEQKMVLSGAPKVEHGQDIVKGYRITIRENMDLIEVDDAMSDVQVKRKEDAKKDKLKE